MADGQGAGGGAGEAAVVGRVRRPLWLKLLAVMGLLASAPVVGIGLALMGVNAATLEVSTRDYHLSVTEDVAARLDETLRQAEDGLDAVGRVLADDSVSEAGRLALVVSLVEGSALLDHAVLFDKEGGCIDVVRESSVGEVACEGVSPSLVEAASSQGVVTEGVAVWADGVRVRVMVPILVGGRVTGLVGSWVSLAPLQERVAYLATQRFGGAPEAILVLDEEHRLLVHADPARARSREEVKLELLSGMTPEMFQRQVTQSGDFVGAGGEAMLGAVRPMAHRPWVVVVQEPQAVAYASLVQMRRLVALAVVVAVVVALGAALVFARGLTAPIQRLMSYARELSGRRFGASLEVGTQDELAVLGATMQEAAGRLEASEARIREEVAIRSDLGRYLPRELVDGVVRREHDMGLGGYRRDISVLFADVVAFTPLTERLEPEQVVAILNQLFTILTEIVFRHGGTVDKFVGDCVMAFWGAPTAQADHAARALAAAEDMLRFLEVGNVEWSAKWGVTIQLAIGVHSGVAVVGNIGSETRMEYTAIGEVVNIAARLEAIANPQQILITEATRSAAGEGFEYVAFGEREVTARVGQQRLYEVVL